MDKYEYTVGREKEVATQLTIDFLNDYGSRGWEAVHFILDVKPPTVVFKRRKKRHLK